MPTHATVTLGLVLAGIATFAICATRTAAQELPGDPGAGRMLAESECAACHEVGKGVPGAALPDPPGFQRIADDPAMTALALRVFLRWLDTLSSDLAVLGQRFGAWIGVRS